eukprot:1134180-Pelagomonas_calceolata.AAC.1
MCMLLLQYHAAREAVQFALKLHTEMLQVIEGKEYIVFLIDAAASMFDTMIEFSVSVFGPVAASDGEGLDVLVCCQDAGASDQSFWFWLKAQRSALLVGRASMCLCVGKMQAQRSAALMGGPRCACVLPRIQEPVISRFGLVEGTAEYSPMAWLQLPTKSNMPVTSLCHSRLEMTTGEGHKKTQWLDVDITSFRNALG